MGSNLGDRLENLRRARHEITARFGPARCSRVYETDPVGCEPGTEPFLNAMLEIDYQGQPISLLDTLERVETLLKRPSNRPRNAPRTIDLDILYVGNLTLSNDEIMIPHPRLHLRRFMLAPMCDLQPGLVLPGQREPASEILARLPPTPAVRVFAESL